MEIVTWSEAKKQGLKFYFTGKPCTAGHVASRYTSGSACTTCTKEKAILFTSQHKDKRRSYQETYRINNRPLHAAKEARRRFTKNNATPSWLTEEDYHNIQKIYDYANSLGYHVDHIIPLKNNSVCGLHVPWNLQAIPATENLKKYNKYKGE